ncbi:asparagine-linked glycosylation protein 11-like [Planoprotostelium fungivorum]|uniref:GDP-Man:Man(3)GlcNAc(2)-PP-Dol alpha-1,2-mannosyltransferase n=1 Tax=Planoprotostelium fungivorum TaxID=1890364 RepID=A0A2P6MYX8_9EUKA|nr:asparagine-linked glycosylation protein 11-like [Planoprotostelium fungivorum]
MPLLQIAGTLLLALIVWFGLLISRRRNDTRYRLPGQKLVAFFHPYCNDGGGGERVLWAAVKSLIETEQYKSGKIAIIVYTGHEPSLGKDDWAISKEIIFNVKKRFHIDVTDANVNFVFLKKRHLVEAARWPRFTMLGQSLGSILLGWEALQAARPDVFIDSMGYAFTFPLFRYIGGCKIIAYVHYPTISTDMLVAVETRENKFNNDDRVVKSNLKTRVKVYYYRFFSSLYSFVGARADLVMRIIVSIAQFRPEKNHRLQIETMDHFFRENPGERGRCKLVMIGSCRNEGDQGRIDSLRQLTTELGLDDSIQFVINATFDELKGWYSRSLIGIHTMRDEHFGIGVVELMVSRVATPNQAHPISQAAGVIAVAHNSAGPKMDILIPYEEMQAGYLATTAEEYADKIRQNSRQPTLVNKYNNPWQFLAITTKTYRGNWNASSESQTQDRMFINSRFYIREFCHHLRCEGCAARQVCVPPSRPQPQQWVHRLSLVTLPQALVRRLFSSLLLVPRKFLPEDISTIFDQTDRLSFDQIATNTTNQPQTANVNRLLRLLFTMMQQGPRVREQRSNHTKITTAETIKITSAANGDEESVIVATEAELEEQLDLLTEKSAETRNIAFRVLIKHMKNSIANVEFFEKNKPLIVDAIKRGLKKGGNDEMTLSAETASLLSIRLGDASQSESIFTDLKPTFIEMINNPALDSSVRAAACGAYSLTNFVSSSDETETIDILPLFRSQFSAKESDVLLETSSLDAYSLLVTTLEDQYIYDNLLPEHTLDVVDQLQSSDIQVRIAAGQLLALFFEVGRIVEGEEFDLYKFSYYCNIDLEGLLDTLNQLVSDKSKTKTKKDKVKQKEPFKDIVASIEHGQVPEETLFILHQRIYFSHWTQLIQLDVLRKYLGTGLQSHFETNFLLHDIFDVNIDLDKKKIQLTQVEKRKLMSPSSDVAKYRSRNLGSQRAAKTLSMDQVDE